MAAPITNINGLRNAAVAILDAMDRFAAERQKFFALGGAPFIAPFFKQTIDDPANPGQTIEVDRTDLDIVPDDVTGLVNSYDAIVALLAQGHRTNLTKAYR